MSEIIIPGSIICGWLIIICLAISIARSQRRGIERLHNQLQAWEKAQGVRRKRWEERLEKDMIAMEQRLVAHIDRLHFEERKRTIQPTERVTYELAHLPRLEDTPLPPRMPTETTGPDIHQLPRSFQGAKLASYDLSYRYLRYADLRNADLSHANLFMADLTGACLRDAKLTQADLSAANFTHADLTNADLTGANLLVTDLYDTLLAGASLLQTRNLTNEQVRGAIVDRNTQLDPGIDITLPRIPRTSLQ
ncbi:pentapeptide repeat-containing protein [Dictyobacter formicarum]|uniref:Pentapeptide repeat-containing protein n=1 Tax=Dictyobacter formicarum TaxID=2778368 RepID=A0ABQ3VGE3_9CHLR|nr:pentapeptide repeat-containing protein [Dictyobacter formicarum]GHO84997.1 hypothetical protein KSZ_30030 [Dictyobacter formicarum]